MRAGVLQLARWGVLDRVVDAGTPAIRRTRFHYGDDTVDVSIKPAGGVDALYAPRRTVLDPILVDAAIAAGAEIRFGIIVTGVRRDAEGRVIGIVARDHEGRSTVAHAPLVIGADGIGSTVARLVEAPVERTGTGASGFVYGYWSGLETDGYEWLYRPGVTAGIIPTNAGQSCVFVGTSHRRFRAEVARDIGAGFDVLLGEASPAARQRVMAATPASRLRSFPGRPAFLRRAWGPGWALVGDAGYFKDPISTHGLTDALRDADFLARAVASADDGLPMGIALARYQATRDRLSLPVLAASDAIARYDWSLDQVQSHLRLMSSAMTDELEAIRALDRADLVPVGLVG